jgi:hypothetical protein
MEFQTYEKDEKTYSDEFLRLGVLEIVAWLVRVAENGHGKKTCHTSLKSDLGLFFTILSSHRV